VLVEHPGGFTTLYAHLDPSSVTLRRKTTVLPEQPLGIMGAWGLDPAPWLHFEVRFENAGATAATVLDSVQLSGRPIPEYGLGALD
jgi:murein DD-endopeptidase MepM/ murein hydrolase activator NlpD